MNIIYRLFNILVISSFILFTNLSVAAPIPTMTDADITTAVNSKLSSESTLSNVQASTSEGVVSLSGAVDSDTAATNAVELAQSVSGVKDVNTSDLTVNGSQQTMTDTIITAKVKGMFIQDKLFGNKDVAAMSISVETNNGVVSLSGTADNKMQINNAIKIAKGVSGVKEVKSTVKVAH